MKICDTCKFSKPDTSFQPKGNGSRRATCRNCRRARQRANPQPASVAKLPKQPIIRQGPTPNQCWCHKPKVPGKAKCQEHLDQDRVRRAETRLRIRQEVIAHYGGECAYCSNDELIFLTIDHIEGGGNTHRKETKEPNICVLLYDQNRRDGDYPLGFQVLCWSCNSAKHFHGEEAVRVAIARLKNKMRTLGRGTRVRFEKLERG